MQDDVLEAPLKTSIDDTILASILAGRVRPGARLGETQMAALFNVSRTLVREAMMRLESRHIVEVSPRRGWFVVEPSAAEASQVFAARRAVEFGLIHAMRPLTPEGRATLQAHLADEREAMAAGDRARLTCLMGDFHIRIVELADNPVLAAILRDLTARTMLIAMLYQSAEHAEQSHVGHCRIVEALERADFPAAAALAVRHIDEVEAGLDLDLRADPLKDLRRALALGPADPARPASPARPQRRAAATPRPPSPPLPLVPPKRNPDA